jgi:hypothetical protein
MGGVRELAAAMFWAGQKERKMSEGEARKEGVDMGLVYQLDQNEWTEARVKQAKRSTEVDDLFVTLALLGEPPMKTWAGAQMGSERPPQASTGEATEEGVRST